MAPETLRKVRRVSGLFGVNKCLATSCHASRFNARASRAGDDPDLQRPLSQGGGVGVNPGPV